jgi:hypothetical protein
VLYATANADSAAGGDEMMTKTTDKGLNRRNMMLVTGGAVAGAGALLAAPFNTAIKSTARGERVVTTGPGPGMPSLATGTYEQWQAAVGQTFGLGGRTNIQLVGVRPLGTAGSKPQGVRTQAFAALFDPVNGQTVAPDLIYTASNNAYGALQIYLGGTSDPRTRGRLVAVFG